VVNVHGGGGHCVRGGASRLMMDAQTGGGRGGGGGSWERACFTRPCSKVRCVSVKAIDQPHTRCYREVDKERLGAVR
jgi:hypothetical protein